MTVEQLLLGKHIEPSGRHIHQHTECQSAAPAGSLASTMLLLLSAQRGGEGRGRHLQSRFGPLSTAFGSANVSMRGQGGFSSISTALIDQQQAANDNIIIHAL